MLPVSCLIDGFPFHSAFSRHLRKPALRRILVGTPSQESSAMAEASVREVVVLYLDHQLRCERLPLGRSLCAPPAWTAGSLASEARFFSQLLQLRRELLPECSVEAGGESDVMQQTCIVVESEKHRAHDPCFFRVSESADNAVSCALVLDLHHPGAITRHVGLVEPLCGSTIEVGPDSLEPFADYGHLLGRRRQSQCRVSRKMKLRKTLGEWTPLGERKLNQ